MLIVPTILSEFIFTFRIDVVLIKTMSGRENLKYYGSDLTFINAEDPVPKLKYQENGGFCIHITGIYEASFGHIVLSHAYTVLTISFR